MSMVLFYLVIFKVTDKIGQEIADMVVMSPANAVNVRAIVRAA